MIIEQNYEKPHDPSLIEDVLPPHTKQYTDPGKEEVRQRSVGSLYRQYLNDSRSKITTLRKKRARDMQKKLVQPDVQVIEPVKPAPSSNYSVAPPLQTLTNIEAEPTKDSSSPQTAAASHDKQGVLKRLSPIKYWLSIAGLTIAGLFKAITLKIFPKRYTANKGLVVDWQSSTMNKLKIAVPVFFVALILVLAVLRGPITSPGNKDVNSQNNTKTPATTAHSNNNQNSKGTSSSAGNSKGSASVISPVAPVNAATPGEVSGMSTPVPQITSPAPSSVGGMGGGYNVQVPNPAPVPSPINSLPPTNTVTIPPTQVQVGDKPVLSTDGLNLTIN
jgi:hypothetical protein